MPVGEEVTLWAVFGLLVWFVSPPLSRVHWRMMGDPRAIFRDTGTEDEPPAWWLRLYRWPAVIIAVIGIAYSLRIR